MAYLRENLTFDRANIVVESVKEEGDLNTSYVYKWTHIPTGKWYVGSRTAKGCHINDGYICSSKEVKPLIESRPADWKREIIAIGSPLEMINLEVRILHETDAKNDSMSFNRHNGNGKFTTLGRTEPESMKRKRIAKLKGLKKPDGFGTRISEVHKGKVVSDATRKKIGVASTGRSQNIEARLKNSKKNSGCRNPSFIGYYISPKNEIFDSSRKAAVKYNVTRQTIVSWSKNNKNGWLFQPKEVI